MHHYSATEELKLEFKNYSARIEGNKVFFEVEFDSIEDKLQAKEIAADIINAIALTEKKGKEKAVAKGGK